MLVKSFPAVPEQLALVRDAVTQFAEAVNVSVDTLEAMRLVCSEAAANVVEHAYDATPGEVHLTALCEDRTVWLVVADDGRGLTVRRGKPDTGFGFAWMARFSDAMTVEPAPTGGVEVSFRFRV